MSEVTIRSISEYFEFISKLDKRFIISRGQKSAEYPLLPSAYRESKPGVRKYSESNINEILGKFQKRSHPYLEKTIETDDAYVWSVLGQHYGLPTPYLDMTYNHIISLLFSVEKAFSEEVLVNPVVYFIDPISLNNLSIKRSEIATIEEIASLRGLMKGPFVVESKLSNKRLHQQQGLFIFFKDSSDLKDLRSYCEDKDILCRVLIDKDSASQILRDIYKMGFRFTHLYPELEYLSKDLLNELMLEGTNDE